MRIVLVGGGTGGHFYPLIAIAEALSDAGAELYYMGPDPYDQESLDVHAIRFVHCPAGKQRRYRSIRNFFDIFIIAWGTLVAFMKILIIYPDVVMSKGGFTSVPVVFAAWLLRIPIVIHESDSVAGRANLFASRFARYIAIAYDDVAHVFPKEKTARVGIPIRKALLQPATGEELAKLGLDVTRPLLLVLGGSSGAVSLNTLILDSLDELLPTYSIIHQTGKDNLQTVSETAKALITDQAALSHYHPTATMTSEVLNMALHAASIVVSRAGSTQIFETALHGKPAILIPIPEEVSHDQRKNAYAYARSGAATVMEEGNLQDSLLVAEITRIMESPGLTETMRTAATQFPPHGAADKLGNILVEIAQEHT